MADTITDLVTKKLDKAVGEVQAAKGKLAGPATREEAVALLKKARTRLTRTIELLAEEPAEDE